MASERNERRLSINSDKNDSPPSKKRRDSTDSYANDRKIIKVDKERRSSDVVSDRDKHTGSSRSSNKNERDSKSPYKVDSDKDKYSGSRSSKGEKNYRDAKSPNAEDSKETSDDNYSRSRSLKNDTIIRHAKSPEIGNPDSAYQVDSDKDKFSGSRSSKREKNYSDSKSPNPEDSKQTSDDNYSRSRSLKNDTIIRHAKSPEIGNPDSAYKVDSDKDKFSGSRSSKREKNYSDSKSPNPANSKQTSDDNYSRSRSLKNDTIIRDAKSSERGNPDSAYKVDSDKDKYSGLRSSKREKNYRDVKSPNPGYSKRTSDDKYSQSRSLKNDAISRDAKSPERENPDSAYKVVSDKDKYSGSRSSKGEKDYRDAKSPNPGDSKRTSDDKYSRSRSLKNDAISRDAKSPEREIPGSARKSSNNIQDNNKIDSEGNPVIPARHRRTVDLLTSKTGGAYIPPAKLRMMQAEITDKSSVSYQRIAWEALKKSIHGFINKVNVDNIGKITRELLKENIVRGRGLLSKSIIQAQAASPTFTHVYASLVSIINSKFPNIGELLLKRLIIQFKRGFRRNDKNICLSSSRFIAHLVNQRVAHEILALEILTLLVETPTDDSVEVAISFLKECGQKLTEVTSKGINAIFEMLKNILHEGKLDKRVQYMIEVMFQIRKDGFKDHPSIITLLELVEEDDQFTHLIMLDDVTDGQDILNVFKFDDEFLKNEEKYKNLSQELLGSDSDDSSNSSDTNSDSDSDGEDAEKNENAESVIIDNTETNLIALRRTIYLTIHSSLDYEECAHKLMKMELKPGQEMELCHMFLDCCAEQRTYEKFYGLLAQRFCMINKIYVSPFEEIFKDTYQTTHRLDTNRLRNVSKFFAHLLFTDAVSWDVMDCIQLNEDDTTSSSRIFIKILFQELAEYMGLSKLNSRLKDPTLQETFSGLFPRDNPKNTRFAINFFTSIGLGGLTDELREHLKDAPRIPEKTEIINQPSGSSSSSSSSESSSDSETSSNSSTSESSSDEQSKKKRLKEKRKKKSNKTKTNKKKLKIDSNKSTKKTDDRSKNIEYKSKGKYQEREDYGDSRAQQKRTTSRHRSREDNNSEKRGSKDSKYDKRERYTNYDRY